MDNQKEYHDPDYPETSSCIKDEPKSVNEDEKVEKIRRIVRQEFSKELEAREGEVMLIDQRMSTSRRLLHRLRYSIVSGYYRQQRLQLTPAHIQDELVHTPQHSAISSVLRDGQRRLHPSVRKLVGKRAVDLEEILLTGRAPRHNARKDYCAMLQSRNYTIPSGGATSLRPAGVSAPPEPPLPRRIPKHMQPVAQPVLTLDEATRNQMKQRYRIIIGNTSKYAPGASRLDRSTHKWLLYVRGHGDGDSGVCGPVLTSVVARLHHSYAPHHTVHLDTPPFHVSRRGWGEFPAKLELHFALPERNKPATVEHTIKLDRNYTGLQTLGAETIVDVWLYSTPEMLKYEYKEESKTVQTQLTEMDTLTSLTPKSEPMEVKSEQEVNEIADEIIDTHGQADNWLDFFSNTTELDVDEMFIKPTKKAELKEAEILKENDQSNDLDQLINTNVIKKEKDTNNIDEESEMHLKNVKYIPKNSEAKQLNSEINVDLSKVKTEVVGNWALNLNANCNSKMDDVIEDLPNELLNQPSSPKKRIMKYMDGTTGKIYYLEMDRNLDLSKVQEIVINSKGNIKTAKISPLKPNGLKHVRKNAKKGGVSLLKPEVKSLLKKEETFKDKPVTNPQKPVPVQISKKEFAHIENDHCYLGHTFNPSQRDFIPPNELVLPDNCVSNSVASATIEEVQVKKEKTLHDFLCTAIRRFTSTRVAVNYMLKKIPLISSEARDPDFVKNFPFVVENEDRYWKLDFAKRRNIEWSRAKLINKMLTEHFPNPNETVWRTKQILIFSRLHGYYPIRTETIQKQTENPNNFYSWLDTDSNTIESNIKDIYPNASSICSLSKFDSDSYCQNLSESIDLGDSDEEIDIVQCDQGSVGKREVLPDSSRDMLVLPVEKEEDRLRFLYIERKCADIGIELRNEDIGSGYSYSAVHCVLHSCMRSFAEELVRAALADKLRRNDGAQHRMPKVWQGSSSWRAPICLEHVLAATRSGRCALLNNGSLGTEPNEHCPL